MYCSRKTKCKREEINTKITNLKNELNEKDKIIEQKDLTIKELKNQLNNNKILYNEILSKIQQLENNINQKEKELRQLKNELNSNLNQIKNNNKYKWGFAITFRDSNQDFVHPMKMTQLQGLRKNYIINIQIIKSIILI